MEDEAERVDDAGEVMDRTAIRKQLMEHSGCTEAVAAFGDFFETPVTIELVESIVICATERWLETPQGQRIGIPSVLRDKDDTMQSTSVLDASILGGPVFLRPSNTGQRLVISVGTPEYVLDISIRPEDIRAISRVAPTPESRIITR